MSRSHIPGAPRAAAASALGDASVAASADAGLSPGAAAPRGHDLGGTTSHACPRARWAGWRRVASGGLHVGMLLLLLAFFGRTVTATSTATGGSDDAGGERDGAPRPSPATVEATRPKAAGAMKHLLCDDGLRLHDPLSLAAYGCVFNYSLSRSRPSNSPLLHRILRRLQNKWQVIPRLPAWHVVSQERMYAHLHDLWGGDSSRVMVDLGSHAGHGQHKNVSDALLWLDYFHAPGSLVAGVDVKEDWAADLHYRFHHVAPYALMREVEKLSFTRLLSSTDDRQRDVTGMALQQLTCCMDKWCNHAALEKRGSDHICRITRMRMQVTKEERDIPDIRVHGWQWEHSADLMHQIERRERGARYYVKTERADTLWRRELSGRRIDYIKIDVDTNWRAIGLEGLLRGRGFKLLTVEVDQSWGREIHPWPFTEVDRFIWIARSAGYDAFMKIPCRARSNSHGSIELGGGKHRAAWLLPLANESFFVPTGYAARRQPDIQDLLLIDRDLLQDPKACQTSCNRTEYGSLRLLAERMASDCKTSSFFTTTVQPRDNAITGQPQRPPGRPP